MNARPSGYESADGMLVHSATCRMGRLTCYFGVERGRLMSARNGLGRFIRERPAVGAFGVVIDRPPNASSEGADAELARATRLPLTCTPSRRS